MIVKEVNYKVGINNHWPLYYHIICPRSNNSAYHVQTHTESGKIIKYTDKCRGLYSYITCVSFYYRDVVSCFYVRPYRNRCSK